MIEAKIRPLFQQLFINPIIYHLKNRVHPNTVTLIALAVGLVSAIFVAVDLRTLAIIFLLLSGYLDIMDGALAREQNTSSPFGTMLDILSDRSVESFIIIGLYLRQPELGFIFLLMMMSMLICISSFLLVGIFTKNDGRKGFFYSSGLMERGESFFFFIVMIIWPSLCIPAGIIFVLLVFWTALYRLYEFNKNTKISY